MTTDCIPEQYKPILNLIINISHEKIAEYEELEPIVFLCKPNNILPVVLDFPDEAGKNLSSWMIAQIAQKFRPEFTIFVSEAWVLKTDAESDVKRDKTQSLEHHPDRIDCVMYSLETKYGIWMGTSEIKKDVNNKRIAGMPDFKKPDYATGRFVNLLVSDNVQ